MSISISGSINETAAILNTLFKDVTDRTRFIHTLVCNVLIYIISAFIAAVEAGEQTLSQSTERAVFIITAILISPIIVLLFMVNVICALTKERQPEPPVYMTK